MNRQHSISAFQAAFLKTFQGAQTYSDVKFDENCSINKESVSTTIGNDQKENKTTFNPTKHKQTSFIENKKTKFIWKPQLKKAAPILKHKKVVQTLRNITQNIKSQLNALQKSKSDIKNLTCMEAFKSMVDEQNQVKLQPQVKCIQHRSQALNQKDPSSSHLVDQRQITLQKLQKMNDLRSLMQEPMYQEQGEHKGAQKLVSPQKDIKSIKKPQQILLYSKYKGQLMSFPLYEDRVLTDKKELRNLTIHREIDNDVDSDEQQIQMGVGFMYEQLMYSCQKHSEMKQRQKQLIQSNNLKRQKHQKSVPLEKVKQKLVFK